MRLPHFARRLAVEAEDRLRWSPLVRGLLRRWQLSRDRDPGEDPQALARSIVRLCAAARLATTDEQQARIQERIADRVRRLDERRLDWAEFVADPKDPFLAFATVLKPYLGPHERGVIFVAFEVQWARLLNVRDRAEFARRYTLVLSPSSSPHNLVNYVFPAAWPEPVFTLISNPTDPAVLARVSDRLIVLPLYASHWVNPARFQPHPRAGRPFDLLMVAAFGKVKRHHLLFKALRRMPADLRVLLIGQDQEGRTAETIRDLARCYGAQDRFTLRDNQSYQAVTEAFCQARSSVILSRREGSCVVIAESLMADTPAGLLDGAEVGSRVFLNEQTGRQLSERDLARDLTAFIREADRYEPRRWAEENIACGRSSRVLNDILREHALARGEAWTQDIAELEWAPAPQLAWPEDRARLAGERAAIRERFGLKIGPDAGSKG